MAVVLEGTSGNNSFLHVMVSTTPSPGNLTTDWDRFRHSAGTQFASGPRGYFDYPGLGVSPDAVVVTGNIFSNVFFLGTKIRVFDKAELYDGDATATFVDINNTADSGATIQPAHHFGSPPAGTFYLLQRWNATNLQVWALTGVPSSPTVATFLLSTSDQGACVSSAQQQGTAKRIRTVCPRVMNSVWRDGSLWGTLTGSDATDTRTVVQWFEVETNGFPSLNPTRRQHGAIDGGTTGAEGEFTFMPSISVDPCNNAALSYTQSSSIRFPEMRYTGRLAGDSLNTMQSPLIAKASAFFFDDFSETPERWGDYSATVIDPADGSFWIAHEYAKVAATGAGNDGRWGTWLANFSFTCTPGATPTPTAVATPTNTPPPSATPTPTPTATPTNTPPPSATATDTPTSTPTPTDTPTNTPTVPPTPTDTATPTNTPAPTITSMPTFTPTPTVTDTPANTPTPTDTPSGPTSTPTKQPDPGDTDLDGCSDEAENGADPQFGGLRNYTYFWDFFDVWTHPLGDPIGWERNRVINIPDILGVAVRFGPGPGPVPKAQALAAALTPPVTANGYHPAFDRGGIIGPNNWDRAPADGSINILDDILGVAFQFGHDCS